MKKKIIRLKTIQLILVSGIAIACLVVIFTNNAVFQAIGHDPAVRLLCIFLWLSLLVSFIYMLIDYKNLNRLASNFRELDYSVSNDPVAGIANRYSCDAIIEKYADVTLPETLGCIMLEISNLKEINQNYGHVMGNNVIQAFADILSSASVGLCFVGRNGGNQFMALFEDCSDVKLNTFLTRLNQKMSQRELQNGVVKIEYKYGKAFNEGPNIVSITQLIGLASRRIAGRKDGQTGLPNRFGCDEMIEKYHDIALPEGMGCIMFDFVNLPEINAGHGRNIGNQCLRQFSDILQEAAENKCFVGRNGGTRFLALFEGTDRETMNQFTARVEDKVRERNEQAYSVVIHYKWGMSYRDESITEIGQLLSTASQRIEENKV